MPTIYEWTVPAPTGSGGAVALDPASSGRRPLAFVRKHDPMTRDVLFDDARRSWAQGVPLLEKVLACLSTEKGNAQRDLEYGVDWSSVENARANSGVAARQAVVDALRRFVDRGELVGLAVQVDVIPLSSGAAIALQVSFSDPKGTRFTLRGRPRA